ncbi:MAG: UbiA prenyltransferase family protein [Clostridia bacterium]|nr:UbiA prenyltransferase family protein [Clostridia bacterium]
MKNTYIQLLRPEQWTKNLFVFLPAFFGKRILDTAYLFPSLTAFIAFSLASSGIYCLNDILDANSDRKHKEKCKRPIASGGISKQNALGIMLLCWIFAIGSIYWGCNEGNSRRQNAIAIISLYIILNIAYCIKLKKHSIIDVFTIATGFVLRLIIGGIVSKIELSHWIILMTFLLALFIAFAKRRDDVYTYETSGTKLRDNVIHYNLAFMNQALCFVASITMVCYIMYTVSEDVVNRIGKPYLYTTSIYVLAGMMRYLQITIVEKKSGNPSKILITDRFIHACILAWILTFAYFLYT